MNEEQIQVLNWWHNGRDYQMGVMLLSKLSKRKNNVLVQTLMKPGKEKFQKNHDKLHYELPKAAGLNWQKMPAMPDNAKKEIQKKEKKPETDPSTTLRVTEKVKQPAAAKQKAPPVPDEPAGQYPKIIRRLKMEYQEQYTARGLLHKKMKAVPAENSPKNMETRAIWLKDMKAISAKMDFLYGFIERYEKTGVVPLEEEVWPKKEKKRPAPEKPMTADELKKRKKNLQSSNTKDRNQLLYQKNRKGRRENPMPDGPKRKKLELRIKKREQEIEEIEMKIVELEN